MMRKEFYSILISCMLPVAAFSASEGVPAYYQKNTQPNANQVGYNKYQQQGYTNYVSSSGQKQVVGNRTYSYQVPVKNDAPVQNSSWKFDNYAANSTMTTNGIALPVDSEKKTNIYAGYSRRFADFQFETGVNSVLEWDDMVFNEITAGLNHVFTLGKFDLGFYGEYTYGSMSHGGMSMDYDLQPYDWSYPEYGIFTISIGDESGKSHHIDFGLSAHHIWDIGGWKLSPRIGYEIFKHNLEMSNHYYPNPGVYIPLLTAGGDYVFGALDTETKRPEYYAVPTNMADDAYNAGLDQVCLSPYDIHLAPYGSVGLISLIGPDLTVDDVYDESMGDVPWGVGPDQCVIIGADGPIVVGGTTHIYETTWSGFYIGLEVEKQMTLSDKLRFYVQFGLPKYSSEGTWPNRTDWQQNPSFLDEGRNGAYSYKAEIEYDLKLSDRLQLALKADTNCYHVGKIDGEQYWAEYTEFDLNSDGDWVIETTPAYTEHITEALKSATWQSFGLYAGLKLSF